VRRQTINLSRIVIEAIMIVVIAVIALPFFWVISTSLRLPKESFTLPPSFFPTSFDFENYRQVFVIVPFQNFVMNSVLVSSLSTIAQVILTTSAAYALSRIEFKGRGFLFLLILSGMMIPYFSTVVPLFLIMKTLGVIDTRLSLILPCMLNPFGVFLVRQFMAVIPKSYDEAAYMDGASRYRIFWSVIVPMARPAIVVASVIWFVRVWNEFFYPLVFISTWEKMTLPLGLTVLSGYGNVMHPVSVVLAGITLSIIPPVLFYLAGQRYLVQGTSLAGIKG